MLKITYTTRLNGSTLIRWSEDGRPRRGRTFRQREDAEAFGAALRQEYAAFEESAAITNAARSPGPVVDWPAVDIPARPPAFDSIVIPPSKGHGYERPTTIQGAGALLLGDLHAPLHNPLMLRRAIYVMVTRYPRIKRVVIGGDTFNFSRLSRHPNVDPDEALNEALASGAEVLRALLAHFDQAWFTLGNHDENLSKKLDSPLDFKRVLGAAFTNTWPTCDIEVTNLDYLHLDEPDPARCWTVGHPSHYSGAGGTTPAAIAEILGRNVVTFHNHVTGEQRSKSGRWVGIDAGHMTDPDKHHYARRRLTRFARWGAGFVVLDRGFAHRYTEDGTDWRALGCE